MSDSTAAIYTVFTSPHHAPMPNHLPTLIVTPHGQPNQILYTYLHTEENRVNYLLTPSPQGDLCVAKLFPPSRHTPGGSANGHSKSSSHNVVRCEASRDLKWTIENTGVMSPIYKIVNQDDTPLYQISKPNPNAEFWTMFYFKYAGHQIPPKRIEFGRVAKNPPEKGGGTRITITGKSEDEKQVWQTLGVGNEDCVEWVVCCACLNLLDDQILQAAERKNGPIGPASTSAASTSSPASTAGPSTPSGSANAASSGRPVLAPLQRPGPGMSAPAQIRSAVAPGPHGTFARGGPGPGAGIASTSAPGAGGGMRQPPPHPAENLSQTYRQMRGVPPQQQQQQQQPPPRSYSSQGHLPNGHGHAIPPSQQQYAQYQQHPQQQQQQRGMPSQQSHSAPQANANGGYDPRRQQGMPPRAPPAGAGRRF